MLKNAAVFFVDHGQDAQNWAILASMIEACKLCRIEPDMYLVCVLTAIVNGHRQSEIKQLLSCNLDKHMVRLGERIFKLIFGILLISGFLSACMQHVENYTPPEDSGLISLQPYPQPNDVCQILGESPATAEYLDQSSILIGCPDHEHGAIQDRKNEGAKIVGRVRSWTLLRFPEPQRPFDAEGTYRDYTIFYYDPQHGTQVEYYSKNGKSFLWYPGNTRIVWGDWKVEAKSGQQSNMCHRYQTNSYNPVTKVRGGNWECVNMVRQQSSIQNRILGDPFGLTSGKVPSVFERRKKIIIAELARRAGIDQTKLIDHGRP